jgi:aminoglycoside phosphotransferase (APT) family kinase protein
MRDFNLSLKDAKSICKKFDLSIPQKVVRLEEGMVNDVFSVNGRYVIKINTGNPDIPKLKKEAELYRLLSGKVPVPKVYGLDESKEILPYSYIVMQYVEGSSLGFKHDSFPKTKKKEWLVKLGKVLASIHSINFDRFGETFSDSGFQGESNYKKYLHDYVNSTCQRIKESNELDNQKIDKIRKYFLDNPLFNINPKASLLHGNYVPANIMVADDDIKAIIDWEWSRSGHNEEEVAQFLYRNLKLQKEDVKSFRQGYENIIELSIEFEERLYAYNLLYYLRVLPEISKWTHRPDKQKEYRSETNKLLKKVMK